MANEKNLKPFKKGKDDRRNLNGRPKLPDIKEALIKVLADEQEGMTALEAVIKKLRQMALKGDIRAIKELLDRGYGAPKQEIDVSQKRDYSKLSIDELLKIASLNESND